MCKANIGGYLDNRGTIFVQHFWYIWLMGRFTKYITVMTVLGFTAVIQSCIEDPGPSSPKSEKEIFKASFDGIEWTPCVPSFSGWGNSTGPGAARYAVGDFLSIDGINMCEDSPGDGWEMYLSISGFNGIGEYPIGGNSSSVGIVVDLQPGHHVKYETDSARVLKVTDGVLQNVRFAES